MKTYNHIDVTTLTVPEIDALVSDIRKTGVHAGIIYCYTNEVNGKRYIGQTIRPHARNLNHMSHPDNESLFHKVVKRYGKDKFAYSVLDLQIADTYEAVREKLNEQEINYIIDLNSSVQKHGYNVAPGGFYNSSATVMKAVDMFDLDGNYVESFASISEANAKFGFTGPTIRQVCNGLQRTAGGYLWAWKGEQPTVPEKTTVCSYTLEGNFVAEYENAFAASKAIGISYNGIANAVKDKYRIAANMYWRDYKVDVIPMSDYPKAVFAYNLEGEFVAWYKSLADAVQKLELESSSGVSHAIINGHLCASLYWRTSYSPRINPKEGKWENACPVKAVLLDGSVKYYERIIDASYLLDVNTSGIHRSIKRGSTTKTGIQFFRVSDEEAMNVSFEERAPEKKDRVYEEKVHKKAVDQYTLYGEYVTTFESMAEAVRETGYINLHNAIINGLHRCGDHLFQHHGQELPSEIVDKFKGRRVYQYTVDGDYIGEHATTMVAAKAVNGDASRIDLCSQPPCINIAYGYRWSREKQDKLTTPAAKLAVDVYAYNRNGEFVAGFETLVAAAKWAGMNSCGQIKLCCKDHWRLAGGYYWRREKAEKIEVVPRRHTTAPKPVYR